MEYNVPLPADLHLHTTMSDGLLSPEDMVQSAKQAGMKLVAVTDHDTVAGVKAAIRAGEAQGITVIPGIELSCGRGEEIHLLGYGFDPDGEGLNLFLQEQLRWRQERMLSMLDRLAAIGLLVPAVEATRPETGFIGRMPLADAMIHRGYVQTTQEAFDRYLNPGRPAYVPRKRVDVSRGIEALSSFGALAVLAHPGRLQMDTGTFASLLPEWIEAGLSGLEAYHASHDPATRDRLDRMARANGLLITGGSDSHGRPEGVAIGDHASAWRSMAGDVSALITRLESIHST